MSIATASRMTISFSAPRGTSWEDLQAGLLARSKSISALFGDRASVRLGSRLSEERLTRLIEGRGGQEATIDGVVEITLTESDKADTLVSRAGDIGGILGNLVDPSQAVFAIGTAHRITPCSRSPLFMVMTFRRNPALSVEQFRHWWLHTHGKLAVKLLSHAYRGYEQLHVDRVLSEKAALAAGVAYTPTDASVRLDWERADDFFDSIMRPATASEFNQDSAPNVDRPSTRSGLMTTL